MKIEFDTEKNAQNIAKHGMGLDLFECMDFEAARYVHDTRRDYGEDRWRVMAPLNGRICVAIYTFRNGKFRVISLRKANNREVKQYEASE